MKDSKTAKGPGSTSPKSPESPKSSSLKSPSMSLFTARVFSSPQKRLYSPLSPPEVLTHDITHITDEEPPAVTTTPPPPPPMTEATMPQASINEMSLETSLPDPPSLTPTQTLLSIPNRRVTEDLCSYCCKPIVAGAKMILEDLQIYSHSSCFKCEVCHCPLGDLHAGDSMWLHRGTVHCEGCFSTTREKYLL
ncbi:filamin-binding LIM protein 1 [Coregonus clupeaformis]|uniref:filamin-binding LIM protein 1 n=2 Tax=Coregonus clupeaformis TaxID=59861 RepID=UPI001E1C7D29|nr:filamin-binding LIM protein 1 [Coregonus clupeaformis]